MDIKSLWKSYKFPNCDKCKEECGKYDYDNLCSNLNYLKNYGQEYFDRMKESFIELKNLIDFKPSIFSFGCGCSLDYLAAKEVFENDFGYFNIDECEWAIKNTEAYKNLDDNMPKENLFFDEGKRFLHLAVSNIVICLFNSLNDIMNNKENLLGEFFECLHQKQNFCVVCNHTRGGNHVLAWNEECFLEDLCKKLRKYFNIKKLKILGGEGIIISGKRK